MLTLQVGVNKHRHPKVGVMKASCTVNLARPCDIRLRPEARVVIERVPRSKAKLLAIPDHLQDTGSCYSFAKALMGRAVVPWHQPGVLQGYCSSLFINFQPQGHAGTQFSTVILLITLCGAQRQKMSQQQKPGQGTLTMNGGVKLIRLWLVSMRRLNSGY